MINFLVVFREFEQVMQLFLKPLNFSAIAFETLPLQSIKFLVVIEINGPKEKILLFLYPHLQDFLSSIEIEKSLALQIN